MIQKIVENGCIASITSGASVGNISEEEYRVILSVIRNKPEAASGYDYKLHDDLTWELYELPAPEEVEENMTI